jgi:hypothetical protein
MKYRTGTLYIQGCCSTVYGTVYGNTVRYGKNGFTVFLKIGTVYMVTVRYGVRYGPFFRGLTFLTLRFMFT